jgi:hypothetical protein
MGAAENNGLISKYEELRQKLAALESDLEVTDLELARIEALLPEEYVYPGERFPSPLAGS